jgi:hypothetical protein
LIMGVTLADTQRGNLISLLSLVWKNKSRLMKSPCCLCVYESTFLPYLILNAWTNIYETWYVRHGNWVHLNCMHHTRTSIPSVYAYPSIFARQRLTKNIPRERINMQQ